MSTQGTHWKRYLVPFIIAETKAEALKEGYASLFEASQLYKVFASLGGNLLELMLGALSDTSADPGPEDSTSCQSH